MSVATRDGSPTPFEAIRRTRPDGTEYWSARELYTPLGYSRWERFTMTIDRAMVAAQNAGTDPQDHFRASSKMVTLGSGAARGIDDFELSRYGAYLVAMNGDPRKKEIAEAQTYFAVKTREAEVAHREAPVARTGAEVVLHMAQQLVEQEQRITAVEASQAVTAAKVAAIEGAHDWFTCLGYAKLHDRPTDRPYLARVGKRATAIMRDQGHEPHHRQDATFGTVNVYPVSVLERAFAES